MTFRQLPISKNTSRIFKQVKSGDPASPRYVNDNYCTHTVRFARVAPPQSAEQAHDKQAISAVSGLSCCLILPTGRYDTLFILPIT